MYPDYRKMYEASSVKQHNIMTLVGNGFDLGLLNYLYDDKKKDTGYQSFYEYMKKAGYTAENNILIKKMESDQNANPPREDWADFERGIVDLMQDEKVNNSDIISALLVFQKEFSRFLNGTIDQDVLEKVDELAGKKLAYQSMSKFLKDLSRNVEMNFKRNSDHFDVFNFLFVNFNYTSLLDSYLYLDRNQFDPHRHMHVDRNFSIYMNDAVPPQNESIYSAYLQTDIVHPHGHQDIPRSILFGADIDDYDKSKEEKMLVKTFWAQDEVKYKQYFDNTELFIIFGMSMGVTDSWWNDNIFDSLAAGKSELIIYSFRNSNEDIVKGKFISSCTRHANADTDTVEKVKSRIYIVSFDKNNTYFLGFEKRD